MARKKQNRAAVALQTPELQAAQKEVNKLPEGRAKQILQKNAPSQNKLDSLQRRFDTQNKRGHIRTHLKQAVRELGGSITGNDQKRELDLPSRKPNYGPTGFGPPRRADLTPGMNGRTSSKPVGWADGHRPNFPFPDTRPPGQRPMENVGWNKPPEERTDPFASPPKRRRRRASRVFGAY